MGYYAKIVDAKVVTVITAEKSFFDNFYDDTAGSWLETKIDGSIRKNYAGIGFSYDSTRDAFIPPQPYPSWTLDEDTCLWEAPTAHPDDGKMYNWNETDKQWDEVS
tara:strand:+ start:196 stop:513 length:318 start_codon:yes stop_codon:yes gene_type:complete